MLYDALCNILVFSYLISSTISLNFVYIILVLSRRVVHVSLYVPGSVLSVQESFKIVKKVERIRMFVCVSHAHALKGKYRHFVKNTHSL